MDPCELVGRTLQEVVITDRYTVLTFTDGSVWRIELLETYRENRLINAVNIVANPRPEHPAD